MAIISPIYQIDKEKLIKTIQNDPKRISLLITTKKELKIIKIYLCQQSY